MHQILLTGLIDCIKNVGNIIHKNILMISMFDQSSLLYITEEKGSLAAVVVISIVKQSYVLG